MRWLVVVLALAGSAAAETPDPVRPCKPVGLAQTDAAAAKLRNDGRFRAALDKQALRLFVPRREPTTVTHKVVAGTVVTLRREGRDVRFVVGPTDHGWDFATNTRNEIVAIERKPTQRVGSSTPLACGCSGAGVESSRSVSRSLYALPDGGVFRGVVNIEYAVDPEEVAFVQRDGTPCPSLTYDGLDGRIAPDRTRLSPQRFWKERTLP